jgi:hypothetical protein
MRVEQYEQYPPLYFQSMKSRFDGQYPLISNAHRAAALTVGVGDTLNPLSYLSSEKHAIFMRFDGG